MQIDKEYVWRNTQKQEPKILKHQHINLGTIYTAYGVSIYVFKLGQSTQEREHGRTGRNKVILRAVFDLALKGWGNHEQEHIQ